MLFIVFCLTINIVIIYVKLFNVKKISCYLYKFYDKLYTYIMHLFMKYDVNDIEYFSVNCSVTCIVKKKLIFLYHILGATSIFNQRSWKIAKRY